MRNWKIVALVLVLMMAMMPTALAAAPSPELQGQMWILNPELDYLILVNDEHPYGFGGEYDTALTRKTADGVYTAMTWAPDTSGDATLVENATYEAFLHLQADLAKRGLLIQLYSGYRSEEDQQGLVDYFEEVGTQPIWKVAEAGCSGHHTGLQLWIYIWDTFEGDHFLWGAETLERQESIPRFKVLHEVMPDYGFIDRYPAGKEEWTGTPAEPYEIRFVGSSEVAHEIMDNNLCLEEYLELNK